MRECFQNTDFALFNIEDLNERMEAIRENIQPIFKHYGDLFMEEVNTFTEFKGVSILRSTEDGRLIHPILHGAPLGEIIGDIKNTHIYK